MIVVAIVGGDVPCCPVDHALEVGFAAATAVQCAFAGPMEALRYDLGCCGAELRVTVTW